VVKPAVEEFPRYVGEDMMNALHSDRSVKRVAFNYPIALSCHIKCHDSIHQGQFQSLAALSHPFVFNNTCSSSHQLAASFVGAGARSYIGTLWNVGSTTATQAAAVFYKDAIGQGNILAAFSAMNARSETGKIKTSISSGDCISVRYRAPERKSDEKVLERLAETYFLWLKKIETTPLQEVKRNSLPIARFLLMEIFKTFPGERLDGIGNLDMNALDDHERNLRAMPVDGFIGNLTEIEVRAEKSASRRAAGRPDASLSSK